LLHLDVFVDDTHVLQTLYSAGDREDAATLWRRLSREPFAAEPVGNLEHDADDPLSASLTGDIVVELSHARRTLVRLNVRRLQLVRPNEQDDKWRLPPEEVERTARLAGLGPARAAPGQQWAFTGIRMVLPIVLIAIITIVVWLSWPTSDRNNTRGS
jgi:hypothetical protein